MQQPPRDKWTGRLSRLSLAIRDKRPVRLSRDKPSFMIPENKYLKQVWYHDLRLRKESDAQKSIVPKRAMSVLSDLPQTICQR